MLPGSLDAIPVADLHGEGRAARGAEAAQASQPADDSGDPDTGSTRGDVSVYRSVPYVARCRPPRPVEGD